MSAPRELRGIGMNIFITHFETFSELKDRKSIANFCIKHGISNESGATIRGSYMEQVLKNKDLLKQCLSYIINNAKKASEEQRSKAQALLNSLL